MADCFAGLQKDLTTKDQAIVARAKIHKMLADANAIHGESLVDIPAVRSSMQEAVKNLDEILKNPELSSGAKSILARERSKLNALIDTHDFDSMEFKDQEALIAKYKNPKFFGKGYPVDTYKILSTLLPPAASDDKYIDAADVPDPPEGYNPADVSPVPPPPWNAKVYKHPQGKVIYVLPDGTMEVWKPDGSKGSTSATPQKLAAGHGAWQLVPNNINAIEHQAKLDEPVPNLDDDDGWPSFVDKLSLQQLLDIEAGMLTWPQVLSKIAVGDKYDFDQAVFKYADEHGFDTKTKALVHAAKPLLDAAPEVGLGETPSVDFYGLDVPEGVLENVIAMVEGGKTPGQAWEANGYVLADHPDVLNQYLDDSLKEPKELDMSQKAINVILKKMGQPAKYAPGAPAPAPAAPPKPDPDLYYNVHGAAVIGAKLQKVIDNLEHDVYAGDSDLYYDGVGDISLSLFGPDAETNVYEGFEQSVYQYNSDEGIHDTQQAALEYLKTSFETGAIYLFTGAAPPPESEASKWAEPVSGSLPPQFNPGNQSSYHMLGGMSSPEVSQLIQTLALDSPYAGIIGKHTSGLTKAQKIDWVHAFAMRNWAKIYDLESSKVSKHSKRDKHPGNPLALSFVPAPELHWSQQGTSGIPTPDDRESVLALLGDNPIAKAIKDNPDAYAPWSSLSGAQWKQLAQVFGVEDNASAISVYSFQALVKVVLSSNSKSTKYADQWAYYNALAAMQKDAKLDYNALSKKFDLPESPAPGGYSTAAAPAPNPAVVKWHYDPSSPALPGYHGARIVKTADGAKGVFKKPGAGGKFRTEIEFSALKLSRKFGFNSPLATVVSTEDGPNGEYGLVQRWLDHDGHVKGVLPQNLTEQQLSDILQEHVLDWFLDNDDAHGENFVRLTNGRIAGLDKGRAWKSFGSNKLEIGKLSTNAHVYYEDVYQAILTGKVGEAETDNLFRAQILRARQMENMPDSLVRAELEAAFANRPNASPYASKAQLIDAIIARKNNLEADFRKLWKPIYDKQGREFPEVIGESPVQGKGHTAVTPQLFADVQRSAVHGIPLYMSGDAFTDMGMLLWEEDGSELGTGTHLRGETTLRRSAGSQLQSLLDAAVKADPTASDVDPWDAQPESPTAKMSLQFHAKVEAAAKTISHHLADGQFNQQKLQDAWDMWATLEKRLDYYKKGLWTSKELFYFDPSVNSKDLPDPTSEQMDAHLEMLNFYMKQFAQLQQQKDLLTKSKAGDYPLFSPAMIPAPPKPKAPEPKPGVLPAGWKIKKLSSSTRAQGNLDPATGKLTMTGDVETNGNSASASYLITTQNGIEIEYRPYGPGVKRSQQGMFRFTTKEHDGTDAKLSEVFAFLRSAGIEWSEPDEQDFELFYWESIHSEIADRVDTKSGTVAKQGEDLKAKSSSMTKEERLNRWRKIMSALTSPAQVDEFVSSGGFYPHLNASQTSDPDFASGRPYWRRFDVDLKALAAGPLLQHSVMHTEHLESMVKGGGALPTESRLRIIGKWVGGSSSTSDQGYGSAHFMFTRQNMENYAGSGGSRIWFSPLVLARTTTYSYPGDKYGDITGAKATKATKAPWAIDKIKGMHAGDNETMVKYGASLFDDIEMIEVNAAQRNAILSYLKSQGITEIRGVPIEVRVSLPKDAHANMKIVKKALVDAYS